MTKFDPVTEGYMGRAVEYRRLRQLHAGEANMVQARRYKYLGREAHRHARFWANVNKTRICSFDPDAAACTKELLRRYAELGPIPRLPKKDRSAHWPKRLQGLCIGADGKMYYKKVQ